MPSRSSAAFSKKSPTDSVNEWKWQPMGLGSIVNRESNVSVQEGQRRPRVYSALRLADIRKP